MTVEEIKDTCIESAQRYYKFLEDNDRGISTIEVYEIASDQAQSLFKLGLGSKIFDTEAIFYIIRGERIEAEQIKIVEYDTDKNILIVKPSEAVLPLFSRLQPHELIIISDLKFLVKRVENWYRAKGMGVALPEKPSVLKDDFGAIRFVPGLGPSENQKVALKNIFTNPFSYIWGAPGTGKTQFVLAYAILHYITNGKKVAIVAPTNNAIDQVLFGVLKMAEKAGADTRQFLRLGTPTKKFAEIYPEICEVKGIQKQLDEVNKRVDLLERMIGHEKRKALLNKAESNFLLFIPLKKSENQLKELKKATDSFRREEAVKRAGLDAAVEEIDTREAQLMELNESLSSWLTRFKKLFVKETSTEKRIRKIQAELIPIRAERQLLLEDLADASASLNSHRDQIDSVARRAAKQLIQVRDAFAGIPELEKIVGDIDIRNYERKLEELTRAVLIETELLQNEELLHEEYRDTNPKIIDAELKKAIATRDHLALLSTEERLKSISVVACTLDGYIHRSQQFKIPADHIFLDEAGYANIVKALTLFSTAVPVTFLGDHMQLPPVCEMNDKDFENHEENRSVFIWSQSAIFLEGLFKESRDNLLKAYLQNHDLKAEKMIRSDLTETFRFGPGLAAVLARYVYPNGFASAKPDSPIQINYVHATKTEGRKSRISRNEAEQIRLLTARLEPDSFIVLTPYRAQIELLGSQMTFLRNNQKILTVHKSQGQEWNTVILSVVDTSDKWFVDTQQPLSKGLNLVNTAVSRVQKRLIIVCDCDYWKKQDGQLISELIRVGEPLN